MLKTPRIFKFIKFRSLISWSPIEWRGCCFSLDTSIWITSVTEVSLPFNFIPISKFPFYLKISQFFEMPIISSSIFSTVNLPSLFNQQSCSMISKCGHFCHLPWDILVVFHLPSWIAASRRTERTKNSAWHSIIIIFICTTYHLAWLFGSHVGSENVNEINT